MAPVYRATDVREAIAKANEWKAEGRYNLFRGQTENWAVVPTLSRLDKEKYEEALAQIKRFYSWVCETPGLEYFVEHTDELIAVAQHYGIPTNFLDFTTDPRVAGFFAEYGRSQSDELGCIVCLNEGDLLEFWEGMRRMPSFAKFKAPEVLRLKVPNLWRLEAQHGVCVSLPFGNFESIVYDIDRIIFPHSSGATSLERNYAYPDRKSDLERLLDQFFMLEKLRVGTEYIHQQFPNRIISLETEGDSDPDLVAGEIPEHPSWVKAKASKWLEGRIEPESYGSVSKEYAVVVPEQVPKGEVRGYLCSLLQQDLAAGILPRAGMSSFRIELPASVGSYSKDMAADGLHQIWDGMRRLPYDNEEVALAMSGYLEIGVLYKSIEEVKKGTLEVEFGADDGSYSRALVSRAGLLGAVRPDILRFIHPRWREEVAGNAMGMLQAVRHPRKLFDFHKFARLFAEEIIPTQGHMRGRGSARLYSPARVAAFGLP